MELIQALRVGSTTLWQGAPFRLGVGCDNTSELGSRAARLTCTIESADADSLSEAGALHQVVAERPDRWHVFELATEEWAPGSYRVSVSSDDDQQELSELLWVLDREDYWRFLSEELDEPFANDAQLSPNAADALMQSVLVDAWRGALVSASARPLETWTAAIPPGFPDNLRNFPFRFSSIEPFAFMHPTPLATTFYSQGGSLAAAPTRWFAERVAIILDHVAVCGLRFPSTLNIYLDGVREEVGVSIAASLLSSPSPGLITALNDERFGEISLLRTLTERSKVHVDLHSGDAAVNIQLAFPTSWQAG